MGLNYVRGQVQFEFRKWTIALAAAAAFLFAGQPTLAQVTDDEAEAEDLEGIEEIVVTGSHIKRTSFDTPSPVHILDSTEFDIQGAETITDVVKFMPSNQGSQFNTDSFTQNATAGTSQFNLRGLGLNSTLVLINGRRQTVVATRSDQGTSYVDINAIPASLVERIEVLKDGASAIYGSDAVAGVVNIITKKNFTGLEIGGNFQTTTERPDSQKDLNLNVLAGMAGDRTRVSAALNYFDRSPLTQGQRDFTEGTGTSLLGQPGAFRPLDATGTGFDLSPFGGGAIPLNTYASLADTGCSGQPGSARNQIIGNFLPYPPINIPFSGPDLLSLCTLDFVPFYNFISEEERVSGFATAEHDFTDTLTAFGEFGFSRNRTWGINSPSYPILRTIKIPEDHVDIPADLQQFNDDLDNLLGFDTDSYYFLGRPLGTTAGPTHPNNELDMFRAVGGLRGELNDFAALFGQPDALTDTLFEDWSWEAGYTWSTSRFAINVPDTLYREFQEAVDACSPSDPSFDLDKCFNPFASALTGIPAPVRLASYPGTSPANSQEVLDRISGVLQVRTDTSLWAMDMTLSGSLLELPGGELGFAAGAQYRSERLESRDDEDALQENYLFVYGGIEYTAKRSIPAVFAELAIPAVDGFDLQAAVRWEDYKENGDSVDPKVSARLNPFELPVPGLDATPEFLKSLRLRGSFGTAFQAPSLYQTNGSQTVLMEFSTSTGNVFRAARTFGNPDLKSQESRTWNLGFEWAPLDGMRLSADYWNTFYEDIIVVENAVAIYNAAKAAGNPCNDPKVICEAGEFVRVDVDFINAPEVDAGGVDFLFSYLLDPEDFGLDLGVDIGRFRIANETSWLHEYVIDEGTGNGKQDVAGSRNFNNFAPSLPKWRSNTTLEWMLGGHTAAAIVRYISSFDDDQVQLGVENGRIDSWTTLDLQYSYTLEGVVGDSTTMTVGCINVTGEDPPFANTNSGYVADTHDPRGRLFYVGMTQRF